LAGPKPSKFLHTVIRQYHYGKILAIPLHHNSQLNISQIYHILCQPDSSRISQFMQIHS